jgi:GAF domain-containing protein
VPIAFVSIVDGDREWFKSHHGIEITELHRDVALCASTIATGRPVTVEDVQAESAFADNPLVHADPSLHGFAAVPMRTHDGHAIGTLCVFDRRTRAFTTQELDDLAQLAAMAMRELDLRAASRRALFST